MVIGTPLHQLPKTKKWEHSSSIYCAGRLITTEPESHAAQLCWCARSHPSFRHPGPQELAKLLTLDHVSVLSALITRKTKGTEYCQVRRCREACERTHWRWETTDSSDWASVFLGAQVPRIENRKRDFARAWLCKAGLSLSFLGIGLGSGLVRRISLGNQRLGMVGSM